MRFKITSAIAIFLFVIIATSSNALASGKANTWASRVGTDLGPINPRSTLNVVLLLKGRNEQRVSPLIRAQSNRSSPYFRRWLTPQQYAAYFGPTAATVSQTLSDLRSRGFSVRYVARNGRIVVAQASVGAIDSTFATRIHLFRRGSESYYANLWAPAIPATLPGVEAVGGLDSFARLGTHIVTSDMPSFQSNASRGRPYSDTRATPNPHATVLSGKFGFGPQDVYTAYDLNSVISGGTSGSGVTIAILLTRQALQSDLNNFDQQFGLPSTSLNRTFLAGTCSSPCPEPTGQNDINEAAIDTEWVHAAAPGATIDTISVGDVLNTSLVLGMEYIVDQLGSSVQIASTSFGVCEAALLPFDAQAESALVDQGVLEGQTWFAASGDFGADDCFAPGVNESDMAPVTDMPASVPDVVAVGGTSMVPPVTNGNVTGYSTEYAWDDWQCSPNPNAFVGGASGGGQSLFYPMPTWQQGKTTNDVDRDVPDVALYADPFENTWPPTCPSPFDGGYYFNVENVWTREGGTSFAAPIWAGIFALIEQKLSSRLGLVNPELYNLENTSAFHQVTTGNNMWNLVTGYNAGAGYNRVTGLGTPDGAQLVSSFVGGVNPTPEPTAFPPLVVHVVSTPNPLPTERAFIPNGGTRNGDNGDVNIFEATPGLGLGNLVQDFQDLGSPLDVAFNATGSTVYVLESSGSNIDTISTSTAPYVLNVDKYPAVAVFGSSVAVKGSNLYVTDAEEQSLTVVPTGGGAYTHIAVGPNPGQVVANPQKSFVYVTNSSGNSVSVVKTTTNAVTQTVPVGSNPVHLAVTSDGTTLFVANQGAGTVTQINVGVTPAVVQRTYFVGGEPTGIAVNADNTIAYVTNAFCPNNPMGCTGNNQSNGVVEQIVFSPIGIQPVRCCLVVGQLPVADAFDPSGQYLWVIESGSFEATVIDTFTNQIYGNFSTGAAVGEEWTGVGNFVHVVPH